MTHLLSQKVGQRLVTVRSELHVQLVDGIQGIADIVAFGQEDRQLARIQTLNQTVVRLQAWVACISGLQNASGNVLQNLCVWTMLLVAIPMVREGRLDGVYLALLALAALASFETVLPLPSAFQQLGGSLEAARRLFEIVDAKNAILDTEAPSPVPLRYDLATHNLSVESHEVVPSRFGSSLVKSYLHRIKCTMIFFRRTT
jgi:ATP-binding cassette, subfamily C, bacterial CydC